MWQPVLNADVSFLAAFAKLYLDKDMLWCQMTDPNIGKAGFLSVHRAVRYAMSVKELERLKEKWKTIPSFEQYLEICNDLPDDLKVMKLAVPSNFFETTLKQAHKHNH